MFITLFFLQFYITFVASIKLFILKCLIIPLTLKTVLPKLDFPRDEVLIDQLVCTYLSLSSGTGKSIAAHHVTPEQAGEVFSQTKPKLAVCYDLVLPNASELDVTPQTRKTYSGPVEIGEDLLVIEVGAKIHVRRATLPTS